MGLMNQAHTQDKKGTGCFFLICGFDKSSPYEIYEKVACPLFFMIV